ncbi:MAG: RNA polymerase factor sigma-54 [Calditrichia bacterium]
MKISQHLELKQQLTPQQIILSTLLQLPILSLEQKLKTEIELNPMLEEGMDLDLEQEMPEDNNEPEKSEEMESETMDGEEELLKYEDVEEDINWDDLLNDESQFDYKPRNPDEEEYERPDAYNPSMAEHLLGQLQEVVDNELDYRIGEYLIHNIKENGYLDPDLDLGQVALIFGVEQQYVERILKKIQKLDPVGIGARNLQECLLVQLEELDDIWINNLAREIVKNHWDNFINKRFDKLVQHLEIDMEDIREVMEIIQKLNPKPGEGYFDSKLNYIVPDFIVEKQDDKFIITLNEGNLPPLRISPHYIQLMSKKKGVSREVKTYLKKKLESARWFLSAIQQRRQTMMKVMQAIVNRQYDFFDKGPEHLKPMIMKEIAEDIGMDISTVSRVVNGKYVQTEHGVFELKSFFTEGIQTADGEEVSTNKVKQRIKELVDKEYELNGKPLSDQQIMDILNKEGYNIARRTVAKYREQLGIPVARLRKKI